MKNEGKMIAKYRDDQVDKVTCEIFRRIEGYLALVCPDKTMIEDMYKAIKLGVVGGIEIEQDIIEQCKNYCD